MGAFFVPISFLIFTYAVTSRCALSPFHTKLLALASIASYSAWLIFYLRCNRVNRIYADQMRGIEEELKERYGIDYQPLTETDKERKCWLRYGFPEYVFGALLVLLVVLWIKFYLLTKI